MEKRTWIYALVCPERNEVRYVGQSEKPLDRFEIHRTGGDADSRGKWIRTLKQSGLSPRLRLLEHVRWEQRYDAEWRWIKQFESQGCAMTNKIYGGATRDLYGGTFAQMGGSVHNIDENLKKLRIRKGISQARLAAKAEVDPSTVNQIENGKRSPSPRTATRLAQALEVDIVELLDADMTSFRPSEEALGLIRELSERLGISQAAVVEMAVRRLARERDN